MEAPSRTSPSVCLLDSGATREHPLLAPALALSDQHTYEEGWGVGDSPYWTGHGTMMAGLALFGDLESALASRHRIHLRHRL
ncbi:MAG: S8 family serine peptidase, partial [Ktedonobacterales bacterium]